MVKNPAEAPAVTVYLPSLLRGASGGRGEVTVRGRTVEECIEALLNGQPLLRPHLFTDAGAQREHVSIFLNDTDVRWLESWNHPVRSGDTLTVLQAVSGG
ncbi:MAG: MoaD/ThiS family protein [Acidobacteriota bacterium]|nr:MoaD/ThiS family protein [Acidobacteriota bacterium]